MATTTPDGDGIREILRAGAVNTGGGLIEPDDSALGATYVVPDGYRVHVQDFELLRREYAERPKQKSGTYIVRTVASFAEYFNDHTAHSGATGDGDVWADRAHQRVIGVIDASREAPEWERHRIQLDLDVAPEWRRWSENSGRMLGQEQFAEFLEAERAHVVAPDAATLLEIVQSLESHSDVEWKAGIRLTDGQRKFSYVENTTTRAGTKGDIEIPTELLLSLRFYRGEDPQDVTVRFRHRIREGQLALGYIIDGLAEAEESAFNSACERVSTETGGRPILFGVPVGAR